MTKENMKEEKKWFEKGYRRIIIDSQIADWDERFQSKLDPKNIVDMYTLANATSVMIYANCHIGNCYWPTKTGHIHRGIKGRDVLGEIISLCHKREIYVVVYYSVIFNNWVYSQHPEWGMITSTGAPIYGIPAEWDLTNRRYRFKVLCPNSPYRDFALEQVDELRDNYQFEGFFFDMNFWPDVCYCPYCQKRYASEVGGEIPKVVNWEDPTWVKFQRKREEWLLEFVSVIRDRARKNKPQLTVIFQSGCTLGSWRYGLNPDLTKYCDYLGRDFYGDLSQQAFISKFSINLTENKPFEVHTPAYYCFDNPTLKPKELIENQVLYAIAHNSAFMFNDPIDPEGTLDKVVYQRIGEVFEETRKYEPFLGGELCRDVGVYFSHESMIDFSDNDKDVSEASGGGSHLEVVTNLCKSLVNNHLPFDIITKKNLKHLSSYQIIILSNLLMVDEDEVKAFREFVSSGGSVYASKYTSLLTKDGEKKKDFLLTDLFGVSYLGETEEKITYIAPREENNLLEGISQKYPLINFGSQVKVKAESKGDIIATVILPYTNPDDPNDSDRFVCIHFNPAGIPTEYPAIVFRKYGKGRVCYVAGDLEAAEYEPHRLIFANLIKALAKRPFFFEAEAPKSVEVIIFHQKDKKRYLINLINFQKELPNIPVNGIKIRIRLPKEIGPTKLLILPEGKDLPFKAKKSHIEIEPPELKTFLMLALEYK